MNVYLQTGVKVLVDLVSKNKTYKLVALGIATIMYLYVGLLPAEIIAYVLAVAANPASAHPLVIFGLLGLAIAGSQRHATAKSAVAVEEVLDSVAWLLAEDEQNRAEDEDLQLYDVDEDGDVDETDVNILRARRRATRTLLPPNG